MSDCSELRELLGGHVLGGLDPREADRLDRHLESCPGCRREHSELAGLPALLDLAGSADAEPAAPPAELEELVLDRFARERRTLPLEGGPARPFVGRRLRIGIAGAALVAVTAAVLLLSGALFSSDDDDAFGHVYLHGGGAGVAAEADLRAVREGTRVDLSVTGMPPGPTPVYELWCIPEKGRWISGGTFRVDARGRARVRLTSAARPGDYKRIVVTRGNRGERVLAGGVVY